MSNTLYLECYSGISGDMAVAALLDLGVDKEVLNKALCSLHVDGFRTEISRVKKSGIDACDFRVILESAYENHDHDMEYLHGENHHNSTEHTHNHAHTMQEEHTHQTQEHSHAHTHHHTHEHRGLLDILQIIEQADITKRAKETATKIFEIIGDAEAKAHAIAREAVHFHEVGAVDSIVDIIAVAVCLDNLNIDEVIVPHLYEGQGFVRCQHGMIPIPVPAVANIAEAHGLTLHITNTQGELVTPTGAAIVAAIKTKSQLPEEFRILKTGIGAGKRTYDRPSMLRAMLLKENKNESDCIVKLESNIDDCSGETLGFVMESLFEAGAKDVFYTPIFMKKSRPAYQLSVICQEEDRCELEKIIFKETTTIGIRRAKMERTILKREIQNRSTSLGEVKVKVCDLEGEKRYYPEYESIAMLCKKKGISYQEAYNRIVNEIKEI